MFVDCNYLRELGHHARLCSATNMTQGVWCTRLFHLVTAFGVLGCRRVHAATLLDADDMLA